MYNENDYLSYNILNECENRLYNLYNRFISIIGITYEKKTYTLDEFLIVNDIKHFEEALEYIGYIFEYPNNWITSRVWNLNARNTIGYNDMNRWINNLSIIEEQTLNPLLPSNILLPSDSGIYPNINEYPSLNTYSNALYPSNNRR